MSRIGKLPVEITDDVTASCVGKKVEVKGPRGSLVRTIPRELDVKIEGMQIIVNRKKDTKHAKSLHGTYRSLINSMVQGVSEGWSKELEIVGTGYRAQLEGKDLVLTVGYSHPVKIEAPDGIIYKVEKTKITVEGIDKHQVGQIAAKIRDVRPPEPYKGKGIMYLGEEARRKAGKAAKTEAA